MQDKLAGTEKLAVQSQAGVYLLFLRMSGSGCPARAPVFSAAHQEHNAPLTNKFLPR